MTELLNPVGENSAFVQNEMSGFARRVFEQKYALKDEEGNVLEDWSDTAYRVTSNVLGALGYTDDTDEFKRIYKYILDRKFLPGGRYLYAAGRPLHQVNNCFLLRPEDSREGWAELWHRAGMILMTGGGVGADYSLIRPEGRPIRKTGGHATGPLALMRGKNELGRQIVQGGTRRSAMWAGLKWSHPDVLKFIRAKDWSPEVRAMKEIDPLFPLDMELTNISVILDDDFFAAIEDPYWMPDESFKPGWLDEDDNSWLMAPDGGTWHSWADTVYYTATRRMLKTGEPGFSVDTGVNAGETLRNPCCEITSRDSNDVCNLGSINLARIADLDEMQDLVKYGTLFLLAGTVYSDVPYAEIADVRAKNRRLGLGIMGLHEWLIQRGYSYEPTEELGQWLSEYTRSDEWAAHWAHRHDLSVPVKTRGIAPTGTIAILAETTSGIEPVFQVAYKRRRYANTGQGVDQRVIHEYVVDPTVKRCVDNGADAATIEDAYKLSFDVEKRVAMQRFVQSYVDQGISSTINLPYPITDDVEVVEFAKMLYRYLPSLRGITVYPDGARGGQPLTAVSYDFAMKHQDVVFEEEEARCNGGSICGA
jgi:ribonucleoside-diphosphate reductase alpha chain